MIEATLQLPYPDASIVACLKNQDVIKSKHTRLSYKFCVNHHYSILQKDKYLFSVSLSCPLFQTILKSLIFCKHISNNFYVETSPK